MTPKIRSSRIGATIANSTMACERWPSLIPMSVAADRHVGAGDDVERAADDAGHEPAGKAVRHDENHVHGQPLVGVVRRRGRQSQSRRAGGADEEVWRG